MKRKLINFTAEGKRLAFTTDLDKPCKRYITATYINDDWMMRSGVLATKSKHIQDYILHKG